VGFTHRKHVNLKSPSKAPLWSGSHHPQFYRLCEEDRGVGAQALRPRSSFNNAKNTDLPNLVASVKNLANNKLSRVSQNSLNLLFLQAKYDPSFP
ncbi:MAG: hypothetical protein ACIWVG_10725, partial [Gloeotrichia echinulata HAB0833]